MNKLRLSKLTGAVILALGVSTSAMAADTSSAMRGKITTPSGSAAANVKIKVIHQPTGTISELTTNESGTFIANGLRVGGPYTVVVDSDTYNDTTLDNIYLELGDTYRLSSQLAPLNMEKIEVSGFKIVQQSGGSSSVFGEDTISNMPSFNRDIKDIARLNPLASINGSGELTFAGNNPRTNSLTVDGIGQNDDFGLNYGGYPTAQPPVALDAIEQISVDVSPFSASKGNFGGGTINAVTKSGTNEFKFSGFYEISTPDMAGDVDSISQIYADGRPVLDEDGHRTYSVSQVEPIQSEERFGFNVGGPLIEDKLFYFVNYNSWKSELDLDYGFEGSGAANEYNVSQEQYNAFLSTLDSVYGMQDSLGGDPEDTNETLLVKLSWNVNDDHRLDFTYQWQDDQDERNFGTGGDTVSMASNRYTYATKFNNFSTKLYSDWNENFSSEIGIAYKDVTSNSVTNSSIGSVKVEEYYNGPAYQFGTDQYRHANESSTENLTLTFDGTYLLDEHELEFGIKYESLNLYNLFAANSLGSWEFDSLDGFANREVGNYNGSYDFTYSNAYTNNSADTAYDATRSQLAVYIEDTFYIGDDLEVNAGLRYERLASDDKPTYNENFYNTYGFSNQENLDGLDIILPRVGFKYYATEALTISGGIGRFQGGIPNVWYNNSYQKDGITLVDAPASVIDGYYANNPADITQVPGAIQDSLVKGAGSTNYIDPNFELPSSIRTQVGFEYDFDSELLGNGFKWQAEIAYHKKENEAVWHNTAIRPVGTTADGERVINESIYTGDLQDNFDIAMTNSSEDGRSVIFSTALAKEWDNGLYISTSYAHQDITEASSGSSSQAQSNYLYNVTKNRNEDLAQRGSYEVEHSFKVNVSYHTEFFSGYNTKFDVYFERRSGRPFSYTMGMYNDGDLGDTRDFDSSSAYLAYIPTGADDPNVNWAESDMSWAELETLLNRAGISERGQILDRNTGTQPWVTTMDISIKQEIPGFAEGHSGEVYFMIDNFANLLNSDWGVEKRLSYTEQALYDFTGLDDEGRYLIEAKYNGSDVRNYSQIDTAASAWQAKIGISYKF
ncbi:TonB-dependent receptor [Pseudoalteromonas shioyasakiensis]|uniref:TonB-dependent receptor n=1 Tax=Pseudoalteromonas shioyasakiensis TaxID=1190813 RepID=UPI0021179A7B|nr:TonB-dependent receptor [Pseudoalteromonas shioyasakiensis]MCQ8878642.1 TonB-dependent receptor [Pseudoalteromonas shioyasakiensis]